MSIESTERELGNALKHLSVDESVRSFPSADEILRLGKHRRARRRAGLTGSCVVAVFLTVVGVGAVNGPAATPGQSVSFATGSLGAWATRGDLANSPRADGTKSSWEREGARGVHVLFAGHVPGLGTPLAVLAGNVDNADLVRVVEWRGSDLDAVLDRGTALPADRDYVALAVSDIANQLVFTYGPDGKPNTPVSQSGALHLLVLTSPDVRRVELVSEESPTPLQTAGDGVFTASLTATKPPAVALDGGSPRLLDLLAQA